MTNTTGGTLGEGERRVSDILAYVVFLRVDEVPALYEVGTQVFHLKILKISPFSPSWGKFEVKDAIKGLLEADYSSRTSCKQREESAKKARSNLGGIRTTGPCKLTEISDQPILELSLRSTLLFCQCETSWKSIILRHHQYNLGWNLIAPVLAYRALL